MRFVYSGPFATRDAAASRLEHLYATGEIWPTESVEIEQRGTKSAGWSKGTPFFVITLASD